MRLIRLLKRCLGFDRDLRSRLWRSGGLLAVFMWTLFAAKCITGEKPLTWNQLGHDFLAFYYGGHCALTGHYEQLYSLPAARAFEQKTGRAAGLSIGESFGPWWNPPFAAWLFAPFAAFGYLEALHLWWALSIVALGISIWLMCKMIEGDWKTRSLAPFLILTAMFPCFQAFGHGQNTFLSLLLLTATVWFWRREQFLWAGMICGLLFYKPQLGAVVAAALCIREGRRAILGVCITGTALTLINVLTMPGALHEFLYQMPLNIHWIEDQNAYHWYRHVTLKAFWRQAVQGEAIGRSSPAAQILWMLCEVALLAGLAAVLLATRRGGNAASDRDRLISAAIIAMPLLMPFYFDYDLLLVSVGIVVYVADRQRQLRLRKSAELEDRWLVRMLMFFYAGLQLLSFLKEPRINPTVLLLSVLAVMLIRRGLRPTSLSSPPAQTAFDFTPAAAAA